MKAKHIFSFFFSFLFIINFAQQKQDSVKAKWNYKPNFLVGFDVLNAGIGLFSHRKIFQGFVSSRIQKNLHAAANAGFEKNVYQKNGYDATVNGPFLKLKTLRTDLICVVSRLKLHKYFAFTVGSSLKNVQNFLVSAFLKLILSCQKLLHAFSSLKKVNSFREIDFLKLKKGCA